MSWNQSACNSDKSFQVRQQPTYPSWWASSLSLQQSHGQHSERTPWKRETSSRSSSWNSKYWSYIGLHAQTSTSRQWTNHIKTIGRPTRNLSPRQHEGVATKVHDRHKTLVPIWQCAWKKRIQVPMQLRVVHCNVNQQESMPSPWPAYHVQRQVGTH